MTKRRRNKIYRYIAIKHFYSLSTYLIPLFALALLVFGSYGAVGGLYLAPADYQQGDAFRIIYVHVPSAFLSLFIYFIMAIFAGISLIFRIKLAELIVSGSVFLGAWFTFLALFTGSVWAKPMWGVWWVWDARLTSELILLFLYLGVIALRSAMPERHMAAQNTAILLILGLANLPIIHYSVYWWNTLHQGATIHFLSPSLIERSMLYPLLAMIVAFISFYLIVLLLNIRCEILEQSIKIHEVNNLRLI
ncbi:heme ABC transporter permease [Candidatus Rickettsiella isopodorum]|jgi:heme exporter protein C|uniref:Heme exporter protein C n=1 Tax=Candidatus Rickettsiella isopodorum TaxID=1225476 RepID=A0A1J8NKG5_9COXI|nr:heme ABC transporter permease CcmC [Candidatus Rickettsiella isopodorum]MCH9636928.1 heme ABC transporter permease CcmC [Gammaproteobacteria bacterium]MDQ5899496.1 Heme exporter protein [Pseudomonadota bacterium]MCH9754257.1 heme ABC transporter permease CcmC [Gammaproteobacteria bacterium]MDD4893262.1 heme ABC transporter permease CcmC [Candidatus Rickettsiella isopodorum]MDD5162407.1 heme ABC transporter permease CcmC [Candidatus Rickettsiella isopodorum]